MFSGMLAGSHTLSALAETIRWRGIFTAVVLWSGGNNMIIKRQLRGAYIRILFAFLVALLGSGCSEEQQFFGNSQVETTFQLKSTSVVNGALTIQHAYLKLDRAVISGASGGKNLPDAALAIPAEEPPFRLIETDSSHITFTLPSRGYDVMDLHLFLFADQYELVFSQRPEDNIPDPVGNNDGTSDGGEGDQDDDNSDNGANDDDDGDTDGGDNDNQPNEDGTSGGDGDDDDDDTGQEDNGDGDDRDDDDEGDDDDDNDGNDRSNGNDEKKDDENKNKQNDGKKNGDKKGNKGKENKDKDDDGKDQRSSNITDKQAVDLDHFFQNAKPGIVIFGTWERNGQQVNVVFVVTDPTRISVRAMQDNGSRIVLEDQNASVVSFDPEQWVGNLTENELRDAVLQLYQGQPVLFIHKDFNSVLFEKLSSRLAQSATFQFDSADVE